MCLAEDEWAGENRAIKDCLRGMAGGHPCVCGYHRDEEDDGRSMMDWYLEHHGQEAR